MMNTIPETSADFLSHYAYKAVGSSRLSNYTVNNVDIIDACFVLAYCQPIIIEHNTGFFLKDSFDIEVYDLWLANVGSDFTRLEYMCNMISLDNIIKTESSSIKTMKLFAGLIKDNWIKFIAPQIEHEFEVHIIDNDVGIPSLTFNVCRN